MKSKFSLIAACIALVLISCDKKEDTVASADSSITTSGTISGQITNYSENSEALDSVRAVHQSTVLGKAKAAANGQFSINLTKIPQLSAYGSIKGIAVSDSNAQVGKCDLESYKGQTQNGNYLRCNYATMAGMSVSVSYSEFIYSDRVLTVKGTVSLSDKQENVTYTESVVYDLSLKKGWNEIVYKHEISVTPSSITAKTTNTSTIPNDFKWYYIGSDNISLVKKRAQSAFVIKNSPLADR